LSSLARLASPHPRSTIKFELDCEASASLRIADTMYGSGGEGHAAVCCLCESWYYNDEGLQIGNRMSTFEEK
jgi:hypothetical protein